MWCAIALMGAVGGPMVDSSVRLCPPNPHLSLAWPPQRGNLSLSLSLSLALTTT